MPEEEKPEVRETIERNRADVHPHKGPFSKVHTVCATCNAPVTVWVSTPPRDTNPDNLKPWERFCPVHQARIRCGDVVEVQLRTDERSQVPKKETLVCAYADYERNEFFWCGWPFGYVPLDEVRLVEACSDEEHEKQVEQFAKMRPDSPGPDRRRHHVLRLYDRTTFVMEQLDHHRGALAEAKRQVAFHEEEMHNLVWKDRLGIVVFDEGNICWSTLGGMEAEKAFEIFDDWGRVTDSNAHRVYAVGLAPYRDRDVRMQDVRAALDWREKRDAERKA